MHRPGARRLAILVLVVAALALIVGTRVWTRSDDGRGAATAADVVSSPIRTLDVVLRADDDVSAGVAARTSHQAGELSFLILVLTGLVLTTVQSRRALSVAGAGAGSRSPRRYAVAPRAPPTFRLV